MRGDLLLLADIVEAAKDVAEFISGIDEAEFLQSKLIRAGVLQKLTTIGEAASRLTQGLRQEYPQVPWRPMRDLRNIAVHNYAGVDYVIIWHTASSDVPLLLNQVEEILNREKS
jgi:uncharacterized protein with HEPN domain